jgi:predicted NUDIX family phosphoesterase
MFSQSRLHAPGPGLKQNVNNPVNKKLIKKLHFARFNPEPGASYPQPQPRKATGRMATEERVLCFERKLLEELGVFQGLSLETEKYLPVVTSATKIRYLNRSEAELDRRYKQLIPYVLVICGNKILRYRRGKGGQETRLHGLFSVGVGGHISEEDHGLFSNAQGYQEGMRRELIEEIDVDEVNEAVVAVINDDSTEVGYVHFGVVHVMYVGDENVAGRRSGIAGPEFIPIAEAAKDTSGYETWSRLCLEHLGELLPKAAAAGVTVPERVLN